MHECQRSPVSQTPAVLALVLFAHGPCLIVILPLTVHVLCAALLKVSVVDELGVPVKFVGVGETADDLQPFNPETFVDALFPEIST